MASDATHDAQPDTIEVEHPDTKLKHTVRSQDLGVWKSQGWHPVSEHADMTPTTPSDLADMTVPQMQDFAAEHDIELDGATKKADIRDAIAQATNPPEATPASGGDASIAAAADAV